VSKAIELEKGFQVIALTNNFVIPEEFKTTVGAPPSEFLQIFDEVIESSVVGLRKPDPRFFQYALDKIKCKPSETVFLDDIGLYCFNQKTFLFSSSFK